MSICRNFYFHGLRAYDITATQRTFHRKFEEDGEISDDVYELTMGLFQEMRYGTLVHDFSQWPHPTRKTIRGAYGPDGLWFEEFIPVWITTTEWFDLEGVEAAVPEMDFDDYVMTSFMDDHRAQGANGEHGRLFRSFRDTAPPVPFEDDELEFDDDTFWNAVVAELEIE